MIEPSRLVIKTVDGTAGMTRVEFERDDATVMLDNVLRIELLDDGSARLTFSRVEYRGPSDVKTIVAEGGVVEPMVRGPALTLDEFING